MGSKKQRSSTGKGRRAVERKAAPHLTAEEILDRALRMIRADGVESLSMRKLAVALGVAPMSLYHHVRNRDELIERVLDSLLARISTPAPLTEGWQQQLRALGMSILDLLAWHPGIARVITTRPPSTEARRLTRYTADVLLAAGFSQHVAALCLATYHTYLYGVLAAQAQIANLLPTVNTDGEPDDGARAVRDQLLFTSFRESSQFGIDSLLSAFELRLAASTADAVPATKAATIKASATKPSARPRDRKNQLIQTT